jgi:N-acetylmuramoyl-L-alanine amidase
MRYFCNKRIMRRFNLAAKMVQFGRILSILVLIFLFTSFKTNTGTKRKGSNDEIKIVVIDAGHGGYDPGCHYGGVQEKNVTLAIALKLGRIIKKNCRDVKIIYTRDSDVFIPLVERTEIANRNKANLFISIHCNANPKTEVNGTETYTMGLHKTDGNLAVAKRENEVILLEDNYTKNYDGFDPKSPEANIIFSLYQNAYVSQSLRLASIIEKEVKIKTDHVERGVKQAGFLVLWKTAMPSVLVETGFLSNTAERKYLNSTGGQSEIANGIFEAFKKYKDEFESGN